MNIPVSALPTWAASMTSKVSTRPGYADSNPFSTRSPEDLHDDADHGEYRADNRRHRRDYLERDRLLGNPHPLCLGGRIARPLVPVLIRQPGHSVVQSPGGHAVGGDQPLVGDSPLIVHAWSAKAKRQMLDKQMKKAAQPKEAKDPDADYRECFYRSPDGAYGFPAIGVKAAMVGACRFLDMKMTEARGAFHIDCEMLTVLGEPRMREDMVRVGMGTADIRYRPEFPEWKIPVAIKFNASVVSPEQIANLLNTAGFAIGIGEWRPEKNGSYGRFHVAGEGEV